MRTAGCPPSACHLGSARACLPIRLSCEKLAQMAGTTRFSVSRLLTEWAEQDIILAGLEDLPRLMDLAEGSEMV